MKKSIAYRLNIFAFLLPALILFVGILIAPIIMSVIYSFHDFKSVSANAEMTYVGLGNYIELFSKMLVNDKGAAFTNVNYMGDSLVNALILGALSVFIQLPLALLIALKLSKGIRGERVYLSIYFMPVLISTVIIGQLWMNIYEPDGLLNAALNTLGIKEQVFARISAGITSTKMPFRGAWTGYKETALIAAFIPILWQYVGYHMLLMYGALKSISQDVIEAATVDGASGAKLAFRIQIPMIKPMLKVCLSFSLIGSFKLFDTPWILLERANKDLPALSMYVEMFSNHKYSYASAQAMFIVLECLAFTVLLNVLFREGKEKMERTGKGRGGL